MSDAGRLPYDEWERLNQVCLDAGLTCRTTLAAPVKERLEDPTPNDVFFKEIVIRKDADV